MLVHNFKQIIMGEAELKSALQQIIIHSDIYFYGDAANDVLSIQIAKDIAEHWNQPAARVIIKKRLYNVLFRIQGFWAGDLTPEIIFENDNPRNNYFRIESYAGTDISFVDGIGSNTGYFKLDNLLNNSTTAAHEYGHSLGLIHPNILDIRGAGQPGIMYPRGTIVDAVYQYNPVATAGDNTNGGTINPFTRKVSQEDIDNLRLQKLNFSQSGFAVLGDFTSIWHEKHLEA